MRTRVRSLKEAIVSIHEASDVPNETKNKAVTEAIPILSELAGKLKDEDDLLTVYLEVLAQLNSLLAVMAETTVKTPLDSYQGSMKLLKNMHLHPSDFMRMPLEIPRFDDPTFAAKIAVAFHSLNSATEVAVSPVMKFPTMHKTGYLHFVNKGFQHHKHLIRLMEAIWDPITLVGALRRSGDPKPFETMINLLSPYYRAPDLVFKVLEYWDAVPPRDIKDYGFLSVKVFASMIDSQLGYLTKFGDSVETLLQLGGRGKIDLGENPRNQEFVKDALKKRKMLDFQFRALSYKDSLINGSATSANPFNEASKMIEQRLSDFNETDKNVVREVVADMVILVNEIVCIVTAEILYSNMTVVAKKERTHSMLKTVNKALSAIPVSLHPDLMFRISLSELVMGVNFSVPEFIESGMARLERTVPLLEKNPLHVASARMLMVLVNYARADASEEETIAAIEEIAEFCRNEPTPRLTEGVIKYCKNVIGALSGKIVAETLQSLEADRKNPADMFSYAIPDIHRLARENKQKSIPFIPFNRMIDCILD